MTGTTQVTASIRCRTISLVRLAMLLLGMTSGTVGCGALDVSDPTAVEESELNDAAGAALLRSEAIRAMAAATDDGAYWSGLLADEFLYDRPGYEDPLVSASELLDRRESAQFEALPFGAANSYEAWQGVRLAATVALPKLRAYAAAPAAKAGEMLAMRGYAALRLAEDFCPGFPLHDLVDGKAVFGPPLSTQEALTKALADFDSAVAAAIDSARVLHLAQVGRARALLALGRITEAGSAVDGVPTGYAATAEYFGSGSTTQQNYYLVFGLLLTASVADQEGGTGINFIAAADPRVLVDTLRAPSADAIGIYGSAKYRTTDAPIVLASGIEARLVEAEAALAANPENGSWLRILNALRTSCTSADPMPCPNPAPAGTGNVAGLPPLTDPSTTAARQDLLFRERAFWLFATGHRLADLRRLVQVYGRHPEDVFPSGTYHRGGPYGTGTSIPFPAANDRKINPAVTGCTSR